MLTRSSACALSAFLAVIFLAPLSGASAGAQTPAGFDQAWAALAAEHRAALDSAGVVGATTAFVHDGEIIGVDYFGQADIAADRPVDDATIYHWASITKTFTAVALMQLRDRGLLALDDPIVDHVPELRDVHNPHGPMDAITLRHLLSHSAGFRGPTWPWGGGEPWHPHEPTEWSQLVAMIPYTEIRFPPGSQYAYSNPGIVFLGRALERVTGDVFEAYVDKNIFAPLGMLSSYFDGTPWRSRGNRSNNYRVVRGEPVAGGPEFNTGITVSNGGLNATVADMARWVAFLAGAPGTRRELHDQVLARESLEEMWTPVVTVDDSTTLGRVEMGLSFFLTETRDGRRLVGHTGSQKSFRSLILVDRDTGAGLIAVYNTAGGDETAPDTEGIRDAFAARVVDELLPMF